MRLSEKRFFGFVLLPTFLCALYFFVFATPIYRSEASIMVSNPSKSTGGFSAFLSGGTGDSMTGAFITKEFVESWGEYLHLDKQFHFADLWGHGDPFSSYFRYVHNDVSLFNFYKRHIETTINNKSGIVTLSTYAFTPQQAHALSVQLLADTNARINLLNGQKDIAFAASADRELANAKNQVALDNSAIADFRHKTGYYRPDLDYTAAVQAQGALASDMAKAKADMSGVSATTPGNPAMAGLKDAIGSYQEDAQVLDHRRSAINSVARQYDALETKRTSDIASMERASQAVQEARLKAASDHYYIDVISGSSEPHNAEFPRAFWDTLIAFLIVWAFYHFIIRYLLAMNDEQRRQRELGVA